MKCLLNWDFLTKEKQTLIYNKASEILCTMIQTYLGATANTPPCLFHTNIQCKHIFQIWISPVFFPRPYTVFNNIFNFWVFHFLKAHGFHSLKKKLTDKLTHKNVKCTEHLHPPLMQDLSFLQQSWWRLKSSRMWYHVHQSTWCNIHYTLNLHQSWNYNIPVTNKNNLLMQAKSLL